MREFEETYIVREEQIPPDKGLLRSIAAKFGLHSSAPLWENMALEQYREKAHNNQAYENWLRANHQWIFGHWSQYEEVGPVNVAHLSSQLFEVMNKIKQRIASISGAMTMKFLDAGASDGKFLSYLNVNKDKGTGVNFLKKCCDAVRRDGYKDVQANIEHLPFTNNSFDYAICTETIEHTLNPMQALNELSRVARCRVFMTIPWVKQTNVHVKPKGWPEQESHVLEFSPPDFKRFLTYSDLKIDHEDTLQIFPEPRNPLKRWWIGSFMYKSFFPKLQYYELTRRR